MHVAMISSTRKKFVRRAASICCLSQRSNRIYLVSRLFALFVIAIAVTVPANAAGLYFLSNSPSAHFTDEDRALFRTAAEDALENAADGEKKTWGNPDTGARGVITLLASVDDEIYGVCRRVRVSNEARGRKRSGVYKACKATNGT